MNKPQKPLNRNLPFGLDEPLTEEELDTVRLLKSGLEQLDDLHPVFEPKLHWLEAQIAERQAEMRRRLARDLAMFLSVALAVLSGMAATFVKVPAVFFFLQAAALLAAPIFLASKERKRVREQ